MAKKTPLAVKKIVYWDACVFLSIIEANQERLPIIEAIIGEAQKGNIEIYTSMLSIAEVAFGKAEKDGKALDNSTYDKINKLWLATSPFKLIEVHRSIVTEAGLYVRGAMAAGIGLKPPDAIHLASAKKVGATVFHTYDDFKGKIEQLKTLVGLDIKEPKADGLLIFPE